MAAVPSKDGRNGVGQGLEAARRVHTMQAGAARRDQMSAEDAITRVRGMLLRRRCDSCGTRIDMLGELDDRVFMKCPECLREYVFYQRPE